MTSSPARIAANQANSLKSSGPKTAEGKARSRGNSLKHGLTGEGVVLSIEDSAEAERRVAGFEAEFRPQGDASRFLVRRAAILSLRMDRCVEQEAAAISEAVRHAGERFDEARMAGVEAEMAALGDDPAGCVRRLWRTPEGLEALIAAFSAVDAEIVQSRAPSVSADLWGRIENLRGRRPEEFPRSRAFALHRASCGDRSHLHPGEADGLDDRTLQGAARTLLSELIAAEVAHLRERRAAIDEEVVALDRAEAGSRALFDASKDAQLARKYEAAAERGFFRALRQLKETQALGAAEAPPAPAAPLGSFFPGSSPSPPAEQVPGSKEKEPGSEDRARLLTGFPTPPSLSFSDRPDASRAMTPPILVLEPVH